MITLGRLIAAASRVGITTIVAEPFSSNVAMRGLASLLARGRCRLAVETAAIVCSTPNEESCQVLASHEASWPVRRLLVTGPEQLPPTGWARPINSTGTTGQLLEALRAEGIQPGA